MFRGAIPTIVTKLADEHIRSWQAKTVYVGCSGSFTVERHVAQYGLTLHSNDVLLFSAAIGGYFSGKPHPLRLTGQGEAEVGWVAGSLDDPASALAALMVLSQFAMALGRADKDNPYYIQLRQAYRDQWPELHGKTLAGIRETRLPIASYASEDVMTWLDRVPGDAAVIAYPPFQAAGAASYFARDFSRLEHVFEWEPPAYTPLEGDALTGLYEKIACRREWLFATNKPVPSLAASLRATAQTSNRSPRIHLYASGGPKRRVAPRQQTAPLGIPYLAPADTVGNTARLHLLTAAQFQGVRSVYMNPGIRPGAADLPVAVSVDGKLAGCFAYSFAPTFARWDRYLTGPTVYLLSDFPVSGSRYERLAKLIVMAACSAEATELARRYGRKPFRSMTTTAVSKGPVSMKYRGTLRLLKREENNSLKTDWGPGSFSTGASCPAGPWPRPWTCGSGSTGRCDVKVEMVEGDPRELTLLEVNARFMRHEQYQQLVANLRRDGVLTSTPFVWVHPDGRRIVLSGNHRVQAAIEAGLGTIQWQQTGDQLSRARQLAIQLSHNAIAGEDDKSLLAQLYQEIDELEERAYSGLDDRTLELLADANSQGLPEVNLDYQFLGLSFLPADAERAKHGFTEAIDLAKGADERWLARYEDHIRLLDAIADAGRAHNVKNMALSLLYVLDVFENHREALTAGFYDPETDRTLHESWVPIATVFGNDAMPASAAAVVLKAVAKMARDGDVTQETRWRAIEYWAASYLGGA